MNPRRCVVSFRLLSIGKNLPFKGFETMVVLCGPRPNGRSPRGFSSICLFLLLHCVDPEDVVRSVRLAPPALGRHSKGVTGGCGRDTFRAVPPLQ